jgi:hypothetical protein
MAAKVDYDATLISPQVQITETIRLGLALVSAVAPRNPALIGALPR